MTFYECLIVKADLDSALFTIFECLWNSEHNQTGTWFRFRIMTIYQHTNAMITDPLCGDAMLLTAKLMNTYSSKHLSVMFQTPSIHPKIHGWIAMIAIVGQHFLSIKVTVSLSSTLRRAFVNFFRYCQRLPLQWSLTFATDVCKAYWNPQRNVWIISSTRKILDALLDSMPMKAWHAGCCIRRQNTRVPRLSELETRPFLPPVICIEMLKF